MVRTTAKCAEAEFATRCAGVIYVAPDDQKVISPFAGCAA